MKKEKYWKNFKSGEFIMNEKSKIDQVYENYNSIKNIKIYSTNDDYREKTSEKVYRVYEDELKRETKIVEIVHEDVRDEKLRMALSNVYGGRDAELLSAKREGYYIDERGGSSKLISLEQLLLKIKKPKEETKTYVCDGAKLKCKYFIGSYLILRVYDESAMLMRVDPIATETDKEIINFEFSSNVDAGEMNYICSKSMSKCDVLNAHWEGLADNVLSSGKKVVVNTSTLHCARSPEPITIVDNGQEFSDWEGMKNDLLRLHDKNAYLFKFIKGGLEIEGSKVLGSASVEAIGAGGPIGWIVGGAGLLFAAKMGRDGGKEILEGTKDFINRKYISEISKDEGNIEIDFWGNATKTTVEALKEKGENNFHKGLGKKILKGNIDVKDLGIQVLTSKKTYDFSRELENKYIGSHIIRTLYPDKRWHDATIDYFKENTYIIEKTQKREVSPE